MTPRKHPPLMGLNREFLTAVGLFQTNWMQLDLLLDYAIGKFLGTSAANTHMLTAGLEFGRKSSWLRMLISKSDHAKKSQLLSALNVIQNESQRNVLFHSYLVGGANHVTFIERSRHGKFSGKEHRYTMPEFHRHVDEIARAMSSFDEALGVSADELLEFAQAALSIRSKASTSPVPPIERA